MAYQQQRQLRPSDELRKLRRARRRCWKQQLPPTAVYQQGHLANLHPHVRDRKIAFDPGPHVYYLRGCSEGIESVTTTLHRAFPETPPLDDMIDKMWRGRNWVPGKPKFERYKNMTRDEIKTQWRDNSRQARELGTQLHRDIELFYNNNCRLDECSDSPEWFYFRSFHDVMVVAARNWVPYRTEWTLWSWEYLLAGTIDMIYTDAKPRTSVDGKRIVYMVDWKRCKELKHTNPWSHGLGDDLKHLDDCNVVHYCLQLNLYAWLLERYYQCHVAEMYVAAFHPTNIDYELMKVGRCTPEIECILARRLAARCQFVYTVPFTDAISLPADCYVPLYTIRAGLCITIHDGFDFINVTVAEYNNDTQMVTGYITSHVRHGAAYGKKHMLQFASRHVCNPPRRRRRRRCRKRR